MLVVNRYPLPEIEAATLANRKIGLGVMGFAELLIRLGLPYRSAQAVTCARQLMSFIGQQARHPSAELANERSVFPNWKQSVYASKGVQLRNATLTSIASTGTLSIIAKCNHRTFMALPTLSEQELSRNLCVIVLSTSSSIEPLFALSYRRIGVLGGQTLAEFNPLLLTIGEHLGFLTPEVLAYVAEHGTLVGAPHVPSAARDLFATALEIEPRQHLLIQAAFQAEVDNAVAKTINLPTEASAVVVADIYREAYHLGLKGTTIYRYGSLAEQVLQLGAGEEPYEKEHASKCDLYQCKL